MGENKSFYIILFNSMSHTLHAEKFLLQKEIPLEIIPAPRILDCSCVFCIKFPSDFEDQVRKILKGVIQYKDIIKLKTESR